MRTRSALSLLVVGLLASLGFANTASADSRIMLRVNEAQSLQECNSAGSVEAKRVGEQVHLEIKDSSCAKLDLYKSPTSNAVHKTYKLTGKTMPRSASFTMPKAVMLGASAIKLRLRSNSGKHSDWLTIEIKAARPELALGSVYAMDSCKGSVKISHSMNQGKPQVNVLLKDVQNCDSFTIESNNGRPIGKTYKIGGKAGKRAASFTLSWKKVIDKGSWGYAKNDINIRVYGQRSENLYVVSFLASK